jgi:16S rRNA (guanine527-N7)-methyltransferase
MILSFLHPIFSPFHPFPPFHSSALIADLPHLIRSPLHSPMHPSPSDSQIAALQTPVLPNLNLGAFTEHWQTTLSWQPDEQQQQQFQQLYHCILEGNHQFNLTRITELSEFWEKHLWDSLRGIQTFLTSAPPSRILPPQNIPAPKPQAPSTDAHGGSPRPTPLKVIDIGTGAGFPGLPIAIAQPTWQVTLLDATRKKMDFLKQVLTTVGIANGKTLTNRVETVGQQREHRGRYDLALVRAVAAASVCAEYALPLLQVGGLAILYRGQWTIAEMEGLEKTMEQLGGQVERVESFVTPLTGGDRTLVYLRKIAPTPAGFPRPIGIPSQKPLG